MMAKLIGACLATALLGTVALPATSSALDRPAAAAGIRLAQARPAAPPAASPAPPASATPQAASPPPPQPIRTEIVVQDNWTVTCRDFADKRHSCSSTLQVVQQQSNQVLFVWIVGKNVDGRVMSVLQTPTGITIAPGVEVKFARGPARKATFVNCETNRCEATLEMDDATIRDGSASDTVDATVTGTNGQNVKFTLPFKGFDKAVAAVR